MDVEAASLSVYVDGARVGEPVDLRGYVAGGAELYWAVVSFENATVRIERKPVPVRDLRWTPSEVRNTFTLQLQSHKKHTFITYILSLALEH